MDATKIQLSVKEMQLMNNADMILTKNNILNKVWMLLEGVQNQMQYLVKKENAGANWDLFKTNPKISKGENYEGLPYLILDYPRVFEKEDIFTIRCMFWWGHFFSCTLQLGGRYKKMYQPNIINNYHLFAPNNFYMGINKDPWIHHFNPDNYQPIKNLSTEVFNELYTQLPQIKIAAKWPLTSWTVAASNFLNTWQLLLSLTGSSYLNDEKGL